MSAKFRPSSSPSSSNFRSKFAGSIEPLSRSVDLAKLTEYCACQPPVSVSPPSTMLRMRCRSKRSLSEIGRAHVCTPVTNAHLVCRLLLEKKKIIQQKNYHTC